MSKVRFEHVKEHIGSIVHADKADLTDPEVAKACMAELEQRGVLVFPGLDLDDDEQLAITDAFGDRVNFTKNAPGGKGVAKDDVYEITLDKKKNPHAEYVRGTFFWHVDGVTIDQAMPKATLLSARTLSDTGGETEFANLYAAYENLSDDDKKLVEKLRVVHTIGASVRDVVPVVNTETVALLNVADDMVHPLVWEHADGRKSLLVGTTTDHIEGMSLAHGRAILRRLTEWAGQPAFTYTHKWADGDFVIWDNCGVMHRVRPYEEDSGRMMHRTTLAGKDKVAGSEKLEKGKSLARA